MAVAISRVTPAVVQRLQVPVQVLLYVWGGNQFWTVTEWPGSSRKP